MLDAARTKLQKFARTLRHGTSDPRSPPMPPSEGLLGHGMLLRDEVLRTFPRWAAEYGDAVSIRVPGELGVAVFSAEGIRHVLQTNAKNYSKRTRATEKMSLFLGKGLVTSDGDLWKRQRRIAAPAFHKQRIEGFAATMVQATSDLLEEWGRARGEVDVDRAMMALTMRIASETLLGRDLSGEASSVESALTFLTINTNARIQRLLDLPLYVPIPENVKHRRATKVLDDLLIGVIAERRKNPGEGKDLLAMLLEARDEETGEHMSDTQLRDEAVTIFAAGHETTSNALSWTFLLLARHPDAAHRLQVELDTVLGGRTPTLADLPQLPYCKSVLQEAMRIYPPAWITDRHAEGDDTICGYHIPAGTRVFLSPWATHRHPRYWTDPETFDPDRFSPARSEGRPAFAYFPFGGGPRICIGNAFAMMEAQILLAMICQRYRLELAPGVTIVPERGITLRPSPALPMLLRPRG
jgi:cytochrome P450